MKCKQKKHYCQLSSKFANFSGTLNISMAKRIRGFIRNFTTIHEKYPLRKFYFRSDNLLKDEKQRHISGKHWFSIHPFSKFEFYRHFVMLFAYLIAIIYDQIDIAYIYKYHKFFLYDETCFLSINFLCFLDMIACFFTGYVGKIIKINIHYNTGYYGIAETEIELDKRNIAKKYLKTFFLPDFISATNIIHSLTNVFQEKKVFYSYASIRHIRLLRLYTVGTYAKILINHKNESPDTLLIIRCCFLFLFLSVFLGSLMCYIPDITSYVYNEDRNNYVKAINAYYLVHPENNFTEFKLFLHSTFDCFCLLVLFRMHDVEYNIELSTLATLTMIIGNLLKIILFLSIFSILNRRFQSRLKYMSFMQEVKDYVQYLNLDKHLSDEVIKYCDVKMKDEYFKESEIFNTLQRNMQYEIFTQSSMDFIRSCHLFKNLPNYFIVQLSLRLQCETYTPGKIAVRYLRTYFIADIFCLSNIVHLTTDLISKDFGFYYIYASLRHIRIIRMVTVEQTSHLLLNNVRFKQDLLLIIQCIVLYVFFSIFFGTMLIYIPDIIAHLYGEDRSAYLSRLKLYYNRFDKKLTSSVIFMHTTYDAFCLLTVFQTKESEKTVEVYIIVIAAMIVGNILKILVFLTVYSIINRRFQSTINHIIFMKEVKNYAESLDLSKQLSLDVYNYLNVKLKQEYFRESEIQKTLQRKMQYEIFAECSMGLMRNCHLFRNLPNYFLVQLSLRLKCETYVPGVTVISVGEIATCMYFIATGTVAVYSADGRELCHLSDGEYVGEIGILQSTARVADIVTIEHCELYRLDIKDFQEVIKPNSKFYKRIYKIAMMRMNAHVNLESDNKR